MCPRLLGKHNSARGCVLHINFNERSRYVAPEVVGRLIDSILTDFFNWERKSVREASRSRDLHKPAAPPARPFVNNEHLRCVGEGRVGRTDSLHSPKVQPVRLSMVLAYRATSRVPPLAHFSQVDAFCLRVPADFRGHFEACSIAVNHLTACFFPSLSLSGLSGVGNQPEPSVAGTSV